MIMAPSPSRPAMNSATTAPFGEDAGDQQRVATVELAKNEKVDFIVVGRPVYQAEDPAAVVEKIIQKL